jgi:hypothetical protein
MVSALTGNAGDGLRGATDSLSALLQALALGFVRGPSAIKELWVPGSAASVTGGAVTPPAATWSTLRASREVNEQISTVRSSTQALGLDTTSAQRPSQLASQGEINGASTSYEKVRLDFDRSSTVATLSGFYRPTGAASNATGLEVELKSSATIGSTPTDLNFKIRNEHNQLLFDYHGPVTAGQAIDLGPTIGLSITFSAGSAAMNDSATTAVSATTPTNVDVNARFDADANLRPRFEGNAQVGAGSFTVDGNRVDVFANDSIASVLARVEQVAPHLSASFDADQVTLATRQDGRRDIVVGNDSSGFLAAVKLAGATTSRGFVHGDRELFSESDRFGGVTAGSFRINGAVITVNPAAQTLQALLDQINGSAAGVTASYDAGAGKVVLTPRQAGAALSLEGDSSGFLAAAHIAEGAQGTAVAWRNPFNGTGVADPLLDPGQTVRAGSFVINGARIAVVADDTVESVLARISASGAGVSAHFDAASERVQLTSRVAGSQPIVFGEDSSGFLAAVKLDRTAVGTWGRSGELDLDGAISGLGLAGVGAGRITINGQSVALSPSDSLRRIAAALDGLTGVKATLASDGRLTLTADGAGGALAISDSSGLLAALQIPTGNIRPGEARLMVAEVAGEERLADPEAATRRAEKVVGRLNESLDAVFRGGPGVLERDLRATLSAQAAALEESSGRALRVEEGPLPQLQLDAERLQNLLTTVRSPAELSTFLSGLGAFAQALPAAVTRGEQAEAAAERADELRVGATRERLQLQPGTAEAIGRLVANRVHSVLESATSEQTEDHQKRKPVAVTEKARKAYGLPRAEPRSVERRAPEPAKAERPAEDRT